MSDMQLMNDLGFGGAGLTNIGSYTVIKELLNTAYEMGIRHFDTAPLYGRGYSEVLFGKCLKEKRKELSITTKFGLGDNYETGNIPIQLLLRINQAVKYARRISKSGNAKAQSVFQYDHFRRINKDMIEQSFARSLMRLKTDYIDFYLLHEGLPAYLSDEALFFLTELRKKGYVRFLGIGSTIANIRTLKTEELAEWDVLQYEARDKATVKEMLVKYPGKTHFHHSCLKEIDKMEHTGIPISDIGGCMMAQCTLNNPFGKVIFSTQQSLHLKNNINAFLKYRSE